MTGRVPGCSFAQNTISSDHRQLVVTVMKFSRLPQYKKVFWPLGDGADVGSGTCVLPFCLSAAVPVI